MVLMVTIRMDLLFCEVKFLIQRQQTATATAAAAAAGTTTTTTTATTKTCWIITTIIIVD